MARTGDPQSSANGRSGEEQSVSINPKIFEALARLRVVRDNIRQVEINLEPLASVTEAQAAVVVADLADVTSKLAVVSEAFENVAAGGQ
jgi:hypothetical protein